MPDSETNPLVTVVTVTYNSSAYVRDAIESVLAQTYKNIEYIIGDDCSTDNTWQIIQEYKDPRIKAYRNEVNLREYPNRNKAIEMAQGKYLMFIDGDDIIYPNGISVFVEYALKFPGVGLIIQKGYYNNVVFPVVLQPADVIKNCFLGRRSLLSSSFASNFFDANILKSIGGLSTKYRSGDDEVRVRIGCEYPILFVSGWHSWPRETPGQSSSLKTTEETIIEDTRMVLDVCNQSSIAGNLKETILASRRRVTAVYIIKCLLTLKIGSAFRIVGQSGFTISEILRGINFQNDMTDILIKHNSSNPLTLKNYNG